MKIPILNRIQNLAKAGLSSIRAQEHDWAKTKLEAIKQELPELLGVAIIDVESGKILASYTASAELPITKAAPYNAEVFKQKRRALQALQLPNERIEDILISLQEQLHLLRVNEPEEWLLYLVVSTNDTNLAIARDILRRHSE